MSFSHSHLPHEDLRSLGNVLRSYSKHGYGIGDGGGGGGGGGKSHRL